MARMSMLLLAAILVAWHGVLVSTPHDHADVSVPQEELSCSASGPSSQTNHLHGAGRLLGPHPCLACLAGPASADLLGVMSVGGSAGGQSTVEMASADLRSRSHTELPLLRGPPARV